MRNNIRIHYTQFHVRISDKYGSSEQEYLGQGHCANKNIYISHQQTMRIYTKNAHLEPPWSRYTKLFTNSLHSKLFHDIIIIIIIILHFRSLLAQ